MSYSFDSEWGGMYSGTCCPKETSKLPIRHCICCGAEFPYHNRRSSIPDGNDLCENCFSVVHSYACRSEATRNARTRYDDERCRFQRERAMVEDGRRDTITGFAYSSIYAIVGM